MKYLKGLFEIIKNYNIYSLIIIYNELYYFLKFKNRFNEFKFLKNKYESDPIPCSFYTLKYIEKKIKDFKLKKICDLGSGYGKVLFYFGIIKKHKIDGIEINKEIYKKSLVLNNNNIRIYNKSILNFDYQIYDLMIINDPLKTVTDFFNLINKLKFLKRKFFIFININSKKQEIVKNSLKIIDQKNFSKNRNIIFCKIKYL